MPPDLSSALMMPVYTSAIIVFGMLAALVIALSRTESEHRAEVVRAVADFVRAVAEVFRWFRPGGPPGGAAQRLVGPPATPTGGAHHFGGLRPDSEARCRFSDRDRDRDGGARAETMRGAS
jgi:hypothetical protein